MSDWGPLAEPLHRHVAAEPGGLPWRENAFLAFWDREAAVYGVVHAITSPNAGGRRARFSLAAGGRQAEIVEPLPPMTLSSRSIAFDLDGMAQVSADDLFAALEFTPNRPAADYTAAASLPGLVDAEPLHHYQQSALVTGTVRLGGVETALSGAGARDRTWGWREEVVSWREYYALFISFDSFDVTMMKFRDLEGRDQLAGFRIADGPDTVTRSRITRSPSGLFRRLALELGSGATIVLDAPAPREAGFFVPLGEEREGSALCVFDEFLEVRTAGGEDGFGLVEHGILREVP